MFATHDSVALKLALLAQKKRFNLVNGDAVTAQVTRSKSQTYKLFDDCDWTPRRYETAESITSWPVLIKPDGGQGGKGISIVNDSGQLQHELSKLVDPLIVEYLPGEEITVDCFTDRHRHLVWAGPRSRERVRAGISMRSGLVDCDAEIADIVNTINNRLLLRGPWFVQLKKDDAGKWKLLEISCRIAGTMVFQRARGINFPLMAVHDYLGRNIDALPVKYISQIDRAIHTMSRIDIDIDHLYVDLDDTLIINGQPTPAVMALIYQYRAAGKQIYLITRHASDPRKTLQEAAISASLFNDIIHLNDSTQKKSEYIQRNSLFIDNHFPERRDVAERENVVALDVDAIEFLLR
ncbi:ATP-grasp domain-containing protein [Pantoea sp.]|uniref:ATP-grasp domain-containing protein n=1 Tax=Pantoea sp. TaxID=69393 RepID=UPI0028990AEF|nr:ATP-grasp domain-containing protein [Pantoea sp.]